MVGSARRSPGRLRRRLRPLLPRRELCSISGGTDIASAFVGMPPLLPVRSGEISCPYLGAKVEAFDSAGRPVVGQEGELVVTAPMPGRS